MAGEPPWNPRCVNFLAENRNCISAGGEELDGSDCGGVNGGGGSVSPIKTDDANQRTYFRPPVVSGYPLVPGGCFWDEGEGGDHGHAYFNSDLEGEPDPDWDWDGVGGLCREPYVAPSGGVRDHYPGGQCVLSPNYPNPYPATSSCSVRATFGDGITSALAFEYFETSPGDDYIEINGVQYSGESGGAITAVGPAVANEAWITPDSVTDWTRKGDTGESGDNPDCTGYAPHSQYVSNLIDGDLTTAWNPGDCTTLNGEYYAVFDLGSSQTITGLRLASAATSGHNPDEVIWYSCPNQVVSGATLASSDCTLIGTFARNIDGKVTGWQENLLESYSVSRFIAMRLPTWGSTWSWQSKPSEVAVRTNGRRLTATVNAGSGSTRGRTC